MKISGLLVLVAVASFSPLAVAQPGEGAGNGGQPAQAVVAQPDKDAQAALGALMTAIYRNNYAGYVAPFDDQLKALITQTSFETVVELFAGRIAQGYTPTYFGSVKKRGYKVHIWKIAFKDEGDDVLAELSMKGGKVGGFFLR